MLLFVCVRTFTYVFVCVWYTCVCSFVIYIHLCPPEVVVFAESSTAKEERQVKDGNWPRARRRRRRAESALCSPAFRFAPAKPRLGAAARGRVLRVGAQGERDKADKRIRPYHESLLIWFFGLNFWAHERLIKQRFFHLSDLCWILYFNRLFLWSWHMTSDGNSHCGELFQTKSLSNKTSTIFCKPRHSNYVNYDEDTFISIILCLVREYD